MMSTHSSGVVRGVIVTLQGTESNGCVDSSGAVYDFVSRYFAPWVGIPEDPVTGKFLDRNIYIFVFLCRAVSSVTDPDFGNFLVFT